MPIECLNANISDLYSFACPFHGWEAIQDFIYDTVNSLDPEYLALIGYVNNPDWVEVTGHGSLRRLLIDTEFDFPEGYDPALTVATTQQSAVADALTETGNLWLNSVSSISTTGHGSVLQRQDAVHVINSGYYQPYTIASCANDVIRGPQDDSVVAFPLPPGVDPNLMLNQSKYNGSILDIYSFVYPGMTKGQLFETPGSLTESRLKWVELPQDPFNGSAIGAVILLPRSTTNMTQEILVCNMGAGWGSSLINISSFDGGTTFTSSVIIDLPDVVDIAPFNRSADTGSIATPAESAADGTVSTYLLPFFPEKPIIVTEAWANYLNPFVPALNTTVIDALMSTNAPAGELSSLQRIDIAKWALAGLLANGLASIGATGTLQGKIKNVTGLDGPSEIDGKYWFSGKGDMFIVDPEESRDWVKLRVDSTIDGYAYNIHGASPKVAISFLLVYCIIALSHVLYAGISGKNRLDILVLNLTQWPLRHLLHLLGHHWRSDSTGHEFHSHHPAEEHLCRYHRAKYLQASRPRLRHSRQRGRRWAPGTCVRKCEREGYERHPYQAKQGLWDATQDDQRREDRVSLWVGDRNQARGNEWGYAHEGEWGGGQYLSGLWNFLFLPGWNPYFRAGSNRWSRRWDCHFSFRCVFHFLQPPFGSRLTNLRLR